jgi:hypothetical protein
LALAWTIKADNGTPVNFNVQFILSNFSIIGALIYVIIVVNILVALLQISLIFSSSSFIVLEVDSENPVALTMSTVKRPPWSRGSVPAS